MVLDFHARVHSSIGKTLENFIVFDFQALLSNVQSFPRGSLFKNHAWRAQGAHGMSQIESGSRTSKIKALSTLVLLQLPFESFYLSTI